MQKLRSAMMARMADTWQQKSRLQKSFTKPHLQNLPIVLLSALLLAAPFERAQPIVRSHSLGGALNGQHAQGYLGIEFHDLFQPGSFITRTRATHDVEIVMVDHDGPAGKAGLRPHDLVQSLNGQPVNGAEALRQMIHDAGAGSTISIAVLRGGRLQNLTAQLESREDVDRRARARFATTDPVPPADEIENEETHPAPSASSPSPAVRGKHFLGEVLHGPSVGLQLGTMPPQLAMYFGAPTNSGLLVQSVETGSPAAAAGLEAGDVILRADSLTLRTTSDWTKRLHASKGRALTLVVLREHRELTLNLQPNNGRSRLDWPFHF